MGLGDAEVRKRSGVDPTTADMDTSKPAINSVQVSKPTGPLMIHFENQGEVNTHTHREREREREREIHQGGISVRQRWEFEAGWY
jgi:hypothetical protein